MKGDGEDIHKPTRRLVPSATTASTHTHTHTHTDTHIIHSHLRELLNEIKALLCQEVLHGVEHLREMLLGLVQDMQQPMVGLQIEGAEAGAACESVCVCVYVCVCTYDLVS